VIFQHHEKQTKYLRNQVRLSGIAINVSTMLFDPSGLHYLKVLGVSSVSAVVM